MFEHREIFEWRNTAYKLVNETNVLLIKDKRKDGIGEKSKTY